MAADWPASWEIVELAQAMEAIIDYRGKSPRKTNKGVPLITAKVVKGGRVQQPNEFVDPREYDAWMRRGLPRAGDVLITTEAPLGEVAQLRDPHVALAQRLIALRGKAGYFDNAYLKYVMQSQFVQSQLRARSSGTTVLGIRQSELRKIQLPRPPLAEQEAIAEILTSLDEKIESNLRTTATLEAITQATFDAWFINLEPVKAKSAGAVSFRGMPQTLFDELPQRLEASVAGDIPEGWTTARVDDIARLSRDSIDPTEYPDEVFEHFSIPAFDAGRLPFIDQGHVIKSTKYRLPPGSVLVSKLNPRIARTWLPSDSDGNRRQIASTEFLVMVPRAGWSRTYLYCQFNNKAFQDVLAQKASGTSGSHQRVSPKDFVNTSVSAAPQKIRDAFSHIVGPMLQRAATSRAECVVLAAIRDAILPELILGNVRVPGVFGARHGE